MSTTTSVSAPQPPSGGYSWRADRTRAGLTHKNELERVTAMARSIGQAAVEILGCTRRCGPEPWPCELSASTVSGAWCTWRSDESHAWERAVHVVCTARSRYSIWIYLLA